MEQIHCCRSIVYSGLCHVYVCYFCLHHSFVARLHQVSVVHYKKWVKQGHVFHDFQSKIRFLNGRFGQFTAKETDGLSENDNEDLGKFVAHLV